MARSVIDQRTCDMSLLSGSMKAETFARKHGLQIPLSSRRRFPSGIQIEFSSVRHSLTNDFHAPAAKPFPIRSRYVCYFSYYPRITFVNEQSQHRRNDRAENLLSICQRVREQASRIQSTTNENIVLKNARKLIRSDIVTLTYERIYDNFSFGSFTIRTCTSKPRAL